MIRRMHLALAASWLLIAGTTSLSLTAQISLEATGSLSADTVGQGDVFELYKDGGRKYTGSLKGGKKDKLLTKWYENGQKKEEGTYKDDKAVGLYTHSVSYTHLTLPTILLV